MSHKQQPIPRDAPPAPSAVAQLAGWTGFAATMLVLVGAFNVIDGLVALTKQEYFIADLVVGNLKVVGWLSTTIGICQVLIGVGVYRRNPFAQVLGVLIAGFSATMHLLFIGHFPLWSVIIMVIDGLIIWALTAHAEE